MEGTHRTNKRRERGRDGSEKGRDGEENTRMHRDAWRPLKEKIATLESNGVCNI